MTIRSTALAITLLFSGWISLLAGVSLLSDDAPAALVMFPSRDFLRQMPDNIAILSATPVSVTLASEDAGLAQRLYGLGARLVLPAGLRGCFVPS